MKKECVVIFPHQLFKKHPALDVKRDIFLVEEERYFTDFAFHKQKLMLHRASMQAYKDYLEEKKYTVIYISFNKDWTKKVAAYDAVHVCKVYDHELQKKITKKFVEYDSLAFLPSVELKKSKKYLMANFYKRQRKHFNILMQGDQPQGGKWSYDEENRKKLPKNHVPPTLRARTNDYVAEARAYVEKHFKDNPGVTDRFIYPVTFDQAKKWLKNFVEDRLPLFGDYEDAISSSYDTLYHSVLSPVLNIGLLTPQEVIDDALNASRIPLNSLEGFIRQIIGWREFIVQIYMLEGKNQQGSNFFKHRKKLSDAWYTATTGVIPVDTVIYRVVHTAYAHHIERLMVLSNYMVLKEIHPHEVYRWFMEMFIDSYDWVMVPNVYGMSLHADGGLMTTKPYVSASNYILKMSDFKKGDWCATWDALFWSFLAKHRPFFEKNPRMRMLLKHLDKK